MVNLKTPLGRLRAVGMLEGISFLILMGIAMPLKYLAGMPEAVRFAGWGHGLLFILYMATIFQAWEGGKISFKQSLMVFVASLLPFGPFVIDRKLPE